MILRLDHMSCKLNFKCIWFTINWFVSFFNSGWFQSNHFCSQIGCLYVKNCVRKRIKIHVHKLVDWMWSSLWRCFPIHPSILSKFVNSLYYVALKINNVLLFCFSQYTCIYALSHELRNLPETSIDDLNNKQVGEYFTYI